MERLSLIGCRAPPLIQTQLLFHPSSPAGWQILTDCKGHTHCFHPSRILRGRDTQCPVSPYLREDKKTKKVDQGEGEGQDAGTMQELRATDHRPEKMLPHGERGQKWKPSA